MTTEKFSLQDFKDALPEAEHLGLINNEHCFRIQVTADRFILIRSSIGFDELARDTGSDSIRLVLVDAKDNPAGSKIDDYTTRVTGWQERLNTKVAFMKSIVAQAGVCDKCGKSNKVFQVQKAGSNKGRWFAKCEDENHNNFKWLDLAILSTTKEPEQPAVKKEIKANLMEVRAVRKPDLSILNSYQLQACTNFDGAVVMEAAPGSGKTRTIEMRVSNMLASGIDPSRIGCFTFSVKGAEEMRTRIAKTLWPDISPEEIEFFRNPYKNETDLDEDWTSQDPIRVFLFKWVCTIHALSFRLLKMYGYKLSVPTSRQEFEISSLIKDGIDELQWDEAPKTVRAYIASAVISMCETRRDAQAYYYELIMRTLGFPQSSADNMTELFSRYMAYMHRNNLCDFEMMQSLCLKELRSNPAFRKMADSLFDYIIVDEAQDTSIEQFEILSALAERTNCILFVGDVDQCVIDGTPIQSYSKSTLAQDISIGELIQCGSGGGRKTFGKVTNIYKHWIDGTVFTVKTASGKSLTTTPEHIYFADYTKQNLANQPILYFTYLMYKAGLGYRVGTTRSVRSLNRRTNITGHAGRLTQEHADKIWIIKVSDTEKEARYWEQFFSAKYGLPTWVFYSRGGTYASYDDAQIATLYSLLNTEDGALKLLSDFHMSIYHPHHLPQAGTKRERRTFTITMFADSRGKSFLHHYAISGSELSDQHKLESINVKTRPAKNSRGWRIEGVSSDIEKIYSLSSKVKSTVETAVIQKARLAGISLKFTPASHVRKGMTIFVDSDSGVILDTVTEVSSESYSGYVYDFDVDQYHNFCAGGIYVHNSMYAFRGAYPEVMRSVFEKQFAGGWSRTTLPINYRSTQNIINSAKALIKENYLGIEHYLKEFGWRDDAPTGDEPELIVTDSFNTLKSEAVNLIKSHGMPQDWFILSRTRAECAEIHAAMISAGIPAINKSGGQLFGSPHVRKVLAYAALACNYDNARDNLDILKEIANVATRSFTAPITRRRHLDTCSNDKPWINCGCPVIVEEGRPNCMTRYYGQASIDKAGSWFGIIQQSRERNRGNYLTMAAKGAANLVAFVDHLETLKDNAHECLSEIIEESIKPWLAHEEGITDDDLAENGKVEDFDMLLRMCKPEQTMEEFLIEVYELAGKSEGGNESESALIGTIHWSKGAERPYVLANFTRCPIQRPEIQDNHLPIGKPADIEEERRLAYVAITRAKENFYVIHSKEWNGKDASPAIFESDMFTAVLPK